MFYSNGVLTRLQCHSLIYSIAIKHLLIFYLGLPTIGGRLFNLLPTRNTENAAEDNADEAANAIYSFDQDLQWDVSPDQVPMFEHRLDNTPFTLTFWMKHAPISADQYAHLNKDELNGKEHVICTADSQGELGFFLG